MSEEKFNQYAHPEALISADEVEHQLDRFQDGSGEYRLAEVDVDTTLYEASHIPGAVGWNWETELCDQVNRDVATKEDFERLMEQSGISNDTTVVLYGDNNNWFAAWAFWLMKYYGHEDVRILDGGRAKWISDGRKVTTDVPHYQSGDYTASAPDNAIRAFSNYVRESLGREDLELVDVRSEAEFTGEILAPEGMTETAQRGGHIPGATNISWSEAVREDGTFKPAGELKTIYEERGITPDKETIAYCRIGERSSHSWFVLHYLLGHENVRNYDGSWTEWGNLVGAPIERGTG